MQWRWGGHSIIGSLLVGQRGKEIFMEPFHSFRNIGWFIRFLSLDICQCSLFTFCAVQGLTMNKSTIKTNRRSAAIVSILKLSICMSVSLFFSFISCWLSVWTVYTDCTALVCHSQSMLSLIFHFLFSKHIFTPRCLFDRPAQHYIVHWQNNMGLNKLEGKMLQRKSLNRYGFFLFRFVMVFISLSLSLTLTSHFLSNTWCRWWFLFFFALSVDSCSLYMRVQDFTSSFYIEKESV